MNQEAEPVVSFTKDGCTVNYRRLWERYLATIPDLDMDHWIVDRTIFPREARPQLVINRINERMNAGLFLHFAERELPENLFAILRLKMKKDNKDFDKNLHEEKECCMMSSTPCEIRDAAEILNLRKPSYMINGLGLGIVPYLLMQVPETKHIRIHEIDPELATLIGMQLEVEAERTDVKLEIITRDAFAGPVDDVRFDVCWHDIWATISSDNIKEMEELKSLYSGVSDVHYMWAYEYALMMEMRFKQLEKIVCGMIVEDIG